MGKVKHILKYIIVFLFCSFVSYYLTWTIDKITLETRMQFIVVFLYFLVLTIVICRLVQKRLRKSKLKRIFTTVLVSCVLAAIVLVSCFDFFLGFYQPMTISITAAGNTADIKEGQKGTEVWLNQVTVDNKQIKLSEVPLTEGWKYKDGFLLSYQNQPNTIKIQLPAVKNVNLRFLSHPWSGTVIVDNGFQKEELNLFNSDKAGFYIDLPLKGMHEVNTFKEIVLIISCFIMLSGIFYIILSKKNTKYFVAFYLIIYLALLISVYEYISFLHNGFIQAILFIIVLLIGYFFSKVKDSLKFRGLNLILFLIVNAIICFQMTAEVLFMDQQQTIITVAQVMIYFLTFFIIVPITSLVYYILTKVRILNKNISLSKKHNKVFIFICFTSIFFVIFSVVYNEMDHGVNVSFQPTEIVIRVTGEKNKDSLGYEVLLNDLALINGKATSIKPNIIGESWSNRDGVLWGLEENSELKIKFQKAEDIDIIFNKHTYSGIVEIIDGKSIKKLDLYSNSSNDYITVYNVKSNKVPIDNTNYLIIIISIYISLFVCIILFLTIYTTTYSTKQWQYNLSIFCLITIIWLLYLYGTNPGGISADTIEQFSQARGILPITDAHPALLTFYYKLIFRFLDSPLILSINQILIYAFMVMVYISYLNRQGVSRKILSIFAILFASAITNGIYASTLWKDIPYTISLLWLSYLMLKLVIEKDIFFTNTNYIQIILCLTIIPLIRHNGFAVTLTILTILFIYAFYYKTRKPIIVIVSCIFLLFLIKGPIFKKLDITSYDNPVISSTLLRSMVYIDIVNKELPVDAEILLKEMISMDDWHTIYTPYSTNSFSYSNIALKNNLRKKIVSLELSRVANAYIKTFMKHPVLTIKDRLYGCNILWNPVMSGYNWRVANDEFDQVVISNDFGYFCKENHFTNIINSIYEKTVSNIVLESIFWRSGLYIALLLVLIFASIVNGKVGFIILTLPVVSNSASLLLSLNWQDYRYVYFIFSCIGFLTISYFIIPGNSKKNMQRK